MERRALWPLPDTLHGLVAGRCVRILLDAQQLEATEAARLMNLAGLNGHAEPPPRSRLGPAKGSCAIAATSSHHDDDLFGIFDGWLAALSSEMFPNLLPMLRRTFKLHSTSLRRNLGERAP